MEQQLPDIKKLEQVARETPPFPHSWNGLCFGCSQRNLQGLLMSFWPLDGGCFSKCQIPEYFCGFDGVAHGGIVASALDEVAAWAINTTIDGLTLTRRMEITYLKPVPTQTDLFVVSLITHIDQKNVTAYSAILNLTGTRLAEATGEFSRAAIATIAKLAKVPEDELRRLYEQMVTPIKEYRVRLKTG
jgi:hypothetical protein